MAVLLLILGLLSGCTQGPRPAVMGPVGPDGLPSHVDLRVEGHAQRRNLSCESRSAADLLAHYGIALSEAEVFARLPKSDNPDLGFVGPVDGPTGQVPPAGYGVHAAPLAALLTQAGLPADALRGVTWATLRGALASGRPVIVWATSHLKLAEPVARRDAQGRPFRAVAGEHSYLLIGYDAHRVRLLDAATGRARWEARAVFDASFALLGRMVVLPRISPSREEQA